MFLRQVLLLQYTHELFIVLLFLRVFIIDCRRDKLGFCGHELTLQNDKNVEVCYIFLSTFRHVSSLVYNGLTYAAYHFSERVYDLADLHFLKGFEVRNVFEKEDNVVSLPLLYFGQAF